MKNVKKMYPLEFRVTQIKSFVSSACSIVTSLLVTQDCLLLYSHIAVTKKLYYTAFPLCFVQFV